MRGTFTNLSFRFSLSFLLSFMNLVTVILGIINGTDESPVGRIHRILSHIVAHFLVGLIMQVLFLQLEPSAGCRVCGKGREGEPYPWDQTLENFVLDID